MQTLYLPSHIFFIQVLFRVAAHACQPRKNACALYQPNEASRSQAETMNGICSTTELSITARQEPHEQNDAQCFSLARSLLLPQTDMLTQNQDSCGWHKEAKAYLLRIAQPQLGQACLQPYQKVSSACLAASLLYCAHRTHQCRRLVSWSDTWSGTCGEWPDGKWRARSARRSQKIALPYTSGSLKRNTKIHVRNKAVGCTTYRACGRPVACLVMVAVWAFSTQSVLADI